MRTWILGLAASVTLALAGAQAGTSDDELKSFDYDIEVKTIQAVNQALTPRKFAEQMKQLRFEFPVLPPKRTDDEVKELITIEVERLVDEKYPRSRFDEIVAEAQRRYVLYKVGDKVTIKARLRNPEYREFTGVIRLITLDNIKLGDLIIAVNDIAPVDLPHFDLRARSKAVEDFVQLNQRRYREARETYMAEKRAELTALIYSQSGYLQVKQKWLPAKLVFESLYKLERKRLFDQLRPEIAVSVYKENQFAFDEEKKAWVKLSTGETAVAAGGIPGAPTTELTVVEAALRGIVGELYGGETPAAAVVPEKAPAAPTTPTPESLFGPAPAVAPSPAPAPEVPPTPAPAPKGGKVDDLYDEAD
jgi:hypothetical protein